MNITISIPVRAIARAVASPFVAVGRFISAEVRAIAQFLAARARASAAFAAVSARATGRNLATAGRAVATTARNLPAMAKAAAVATKMGALRAATATWAAAKVGGMFSVNLAGNMFNAVMGPLSAWWVGNTATLMGATWLGIGLHWFAVFALAAAIAVGIVTAVQTTQAWTRRKARAKAAGVVVFTEAQEAMYAVPVVVPADAPDPLPDVDAGINANFDDLADEDEAKEKATFAVQIQASLDELTPEYILANAEAVGAAFFETLPVGDSEDYKEARRQFRTWMQANKSLSGKVSLALRGYDKARSARLSKPALISV